MHMRSVVCLTAGGFTFGKTPEPLTLGPECREDTTVQQLSGRLICSCCLRAGIQRTVQLSPPADPRPQEVSRAGLLSSSRHSQQRVGPGSARQIHATGLTLVQAGPGEGTRRPSSYFLLEGCGVLLVRGFGQAACRPGKDQESEEGRRLLEADPARLMWEIDLVHCCPAEGLLRAARSVAKQRRKESQSGRRSDLCRECRLLPPLHADLRGVSPVRCCFGTPASSSGQASLLAAVTSRVRSQLGTSKSPCGAYPMRICA